MTHYICTGGCGAVVENPGICQAMSCPKHGFPLEACDCTDNQHYGKIDKQAGAVKETASEVREDKKWWQIWK